MARGPTNNLLTGNLPEVFHPPAAGPGARHADPPPEDPWQRPRVATGTPPPVVETDEGMRVLEAIESLPLDDSSHAVVRLAVAHGYEGLAAILDEALAQSQSGKGKERHASAGQRYEEQPMQVISGLLDSNAGMAFQAIKKMTEACKQIDRGNVESGVRDLLGSINYAAGIILRARSKG